MPIPAAPGGPSGVAATVLRLFEQLHDQIREEIDGLDDAALNWSAGAGSNSIATIVTHVVGSEAETLRCVANVPCVRDRDAEFTDGTRSMAEVLGELDVADTLIAALRPEIGANRLTATVALPTLPAHERRTGLTWLVGNYGHGREHVGHIQMTKQLYRARSATDQSVSDQSVSDQSVSDQSVSDQSVSDQSVSDQSVSE